MKAKSVTMAKTLIVLFAFVLFGSCTQKDEADDDNGACVPLGHYPDSSEWPYFSECMEKSGSMEKSDEGSPFPCSEEFVLLSWDGNSISIRHDCIPGQCGWKFEHEFLIDDSTITLIERDTSTEVAGCSCKFRGAFHESVEAGVYEFRIIADAAAWGGEVATRLSEPIELTASESAEYCFHIEY
ncbi:MAG: hypothetical protein IT350_08300 [Deltaproteobacteria bacterium]|nr:hypothetical protein [Deltaproteobacteria bacterium]